MLSDQRASRVPPRRTRFDPAAVLTIGLLIAVAAVAWVMAFAPSLGLTAPMSMGAGSDMMTSSMSGSAEEWVAGGAAFLVAWGLMMAAMMLPSAAPTIALYGTMRRGRGNGPGRGVPVSGFAAVYVLVWTATGLPIYVASVLVGDVMAASPVAGGAGRYLVGALLLAAGLYQFSPLKHACLRACRSPLGVLLGRWREGYGGTLRMALDHALSCVGCCAALMAVLVGAGSMGLRWALLIAALVFAEKVLPFGEWTSRVAGGLLLVLGGFVLVTPGLFMVLAG